MLYKRFRWLCTYVTEARSVPEKGIVTLLMTIVRYQLVLVLRG
jgi:hypothetical protein